jgi:hypothetical protein
MQIKIIVILIFTIPIMFIPERTNAQEVPIGMPIDSIVRIWSNFELDTTVLSGDEIEKIIPPAPYTLEATGVTIFGKLVKVEAELDSSQRLSNTRYIFKGPMKERHKWRQQALERLKSEFGKPWVFKSVHGVPPPPAAPYKEKSWFTNDRYANVTLDDRANFESYSISIFSH